MLYLRVVSSIQGAQVGACMVTDVTQCYYMFTSSFSSEENPFGYS